MKYKWEKAPERMAKDIRMEAEGALQGHIIMNTMTLFLVIPISILFFWIFLDAESKGIKEITFGVIIPVITLYSFIGSFIIKIKSYYQVKKGEFMKLETEFVTYGPAGRYNTGLIVLVYVEDKLKEHNYKLIGIKPSNLKEGDTIVLLRTECDNDVFFAKK